MKRLVERVKEQYLHKVGTPKVQFFPNILLLLLQSYILLLHY